MDGLFANRDFAGLKNLVTLSLMKTLGELNNKIVRRQMSRAMSRIIFSPKDSSGRFIKIIFVTFARLLAFNLFNHYVGKQLTFKHGVQLWQRTM